MLRTGGESNTSSKSHHQLAKVYSQMQNWLVISLLNTFEKQKVPVSPPEDESPLCNIVTGRVFYDAIYENLISAYSSGQRFYQDFVEERLKPDCKIGIFGKLKKTIIKTCKSSNKGVKTKLKDNVATLNKEIIFI